MDVGLSRKRIFESIRFTKKWPAVQQTQFLQRLAELLQEGFSLNDALEFLQMMLGQQAPQVRAIRNIIAKGGSFSEAIRPHNFPEEIVVQLHLSMQRGNFEETLLFCAQYMGTRHKQLQSFKKVAAYPVFMLALSVGMLFVIRRFLLPTLQFSSSDSDKTLQNLVFLLEYAPQILLGTTLFLLLNIWLFRYWLNKKSAFQKALFYCKLPFLGKWLQQYYSFFFSREFAHFMMNGQTINKIISHMQSEFCSDLMKELATEIERKLLEGHSFPSIIKQIPLFSQEMSWLIYHGELTSQVGFKLNMFSQECYRQLLNRIEKSLNMIQPILFLVIGLLIVLIYLILMLPMLSMMRGVF